MSQNPAIPESAAPSDKTSERQALTQELKGIWSNLLKLEEVGPGDNFFAQGGQSLLAARIVAQARKAPGAAGVTLRAFHQSPTIKGLVENAMEASPASAKDNSPE